MEDNCRMALIECFLSLASPCYSDAAFRKQSAGDDAVLLDRHDQPKLEEDTGQQTESSIPIIVCVLCRNQAKTFPGPFCAVTSNFIHLLSFQLPLPPPSQSESEPQRAQYCSCIHHTT
jgi:hypothetical protein